MKAKTYLVPVLLVLFTLGSCGLKGIKVPDDKKDYVGVWTSPEITLSISESGKVSYKKESGNNSTEINAPIQKFEGNNFVVGALGINTTFVVSETPHQDGTGIWKMTVDGVEVSRN